MYGIESTIDGNYKHISKNSDEVEKYLEAYNTIRDKINSSDTINRNRQAALLELKAKGERDRELFNGRTFRFQYIKNYMEWYNIIFEKTPDFTQKMRIKYTLLTDKENAIENLYETIEQSMSKDDLSNKDYLYSFNLCGTVSEVETMNEITMKEGPHSTVIKIKIRLKEYNCNLITEVTNIPEPFKVGDVILTRICFMPPYRKRTFSITEYPTYYSTGPILKCYESDLQ